MNICEACVKIAFLCNENEEPQWAITFLNFAARLEYLEQEEIKREIRNVYTGPGSFNDLVLHKNGAALVTENKELDGLRNDLHQLLTA